MACSSCGGSKPRNTYGRPEKPAAPSVMQSTTRSFQLGPYVHGSNRALAGPRVPTASLKTAGTSVKKIKRF